jgi:hypothetical protein
MGELRHDGWQMLGSVVASVVEELERSARRRDALCDGRASGRGEEIAAPVGEKHNGASVTALARADRSARDQMP